MPFHCTLYRCFALAGAVLLGLSARPDVAWAAAEADVIEIGLADSVEQPADEALQVVLLPVVAEETEPVASEDLVISPVPQLDGNAISLAEALARALTDNPELAALQREVYAAQGRQLQGSLTPSPEVEASISEFLGTAEMRWFRSAVTGVGISQQIERGQKACARMAVASQEQEVAQYEVERTRLDIMQRVTAAYTNALVAQERLLLALEKEELARLVYDVVSLLVEGGKAARLELTRVEVSRATAALEVEQVKREHATALRALASLWGAEEPDFELVEGRLSLPDEVPGVEQLRALLADSPDLARWEAQVELRRAELNLARANGVPDLTVRGGLERFEETDSFGWTVGVSMPINWRNRNQGSVVEAQEYLAQVEELRAAQRRELERELVLIYGDISSAYARAASLVQSVLPPAEETFELIELGYRYGKFDLLDVLDAQRTVIDARSQYVDALAQYQLAAVELERLVASPLAGVMLMDGARDVWTDTARSLSECIESEAMDINTTEDTSHE